MERRTRYRVLEAAIREGIDSGVSDMSVPEIMENVEARLRADGRLKADTQSSRRTGIHKN